MTMTMIQTQEAPERVMTEKELAARIDALVATIEQYIAYHRALGWHGRVERHETRKENARIALADVRNAATDVTKGTARRNAQVLLLELEAAYRNAP